MLNELYSLSQALEINGLSLLTLHPDIQRPTRKSGLVVYLGEEGKIKDLEICEAGRFAEFWSFGNGNHNRFPVIRLQAPLLADPADSAEKHKRYPLLSPVELQQLMAGDYKGLALPANAKETESWERLHERVREREKILRKQEMKKGLDAFFVLIQRFYRYNDWSYFLEALKEGIKGKAAYIPFRSDEKRNSRDERVQQLDFFHTLLRGSWDQKKNKAVCGIQIALEIADPERFGSRIMGPETMIAVSNGLFREEAQDSPQEQTGNCSLSGIECRLQNEKFPNPKLPLLGNTFLFSVNRDIPCQTRYNQTANGIIPIGSSVVQKMKDSVEWIVDSKREGITWSSVPGRNGNDLLVVYMENHPHEDLALSRLFGLSGGSRQAEVAFETDLPPFSWTGDSKMKRGNLWAKEASITMIAFAEWRWIGGFAAAKPARR